MRVGFSYMFFLSALSNTDRSSVLPTRSRRSPAERFLPRTTRPKLIIAQACWERKAARAANRRVVFFFLSFLVLIVSVSAISIVVLLGTAIRPPALALARMHDPFRSWQIRRFASDCNDCEGECASNSEIDSFAYRGDRKGVHGVAW